MDGKHGMARSLEVTTSTLRAVYDALAAARVELDSTLLKPNMVLPGTQSGRIASPAEVADFTLRCLRATVPPAVPGVVFLSGGQSEREATANLSAINERGPHPWEVSFSYGRALQASALEAWRGSADNVEAAQRAFLHRARCKRRRPPRRVDGGHGGRGRLTSRRAAARMARPRMPKRSVQRRTGARDVHRSFRGGHAEDGQEQAVDDV